MQLALLVDGASAPGRVLDADASAAAIAVVLIDNAIAAAAVTHDLGADAASALPV